jgi:hypothetical protein
MQCVQQAHPVCVRKRKGDLDKRVVQHFWYQQPEHLHYNARNVDEQLVWWRKLQYFWLQLEEQLPERGGNLDARFV